MNNEIKPGGDSAKIVLRVARGKVVSHERMLPHRPGWTPAPDPHQYVKVDPYRGRDYEALTKAAKRRPAAYYGDKPPSDDPTLKFCGGGQNTVPVAVPKPDAAPTATQPANTWHLADDSSGLVLNGCTMFNLYGACITASGSGGFTLEDYWRAVPQSEALAWLRAHGHAAEADKWEPKPAPQPAADDLYEPVGTTPVVGDVMCGKFGAQYVCTGIHEEDGRKFGSIGFAKTWRCFDYFMSGEYRILKRQKPATIRAWMGSDDHRPWVWDGARMWSLCSDGEWRFGYSTPDHLPCPHLVELPHDEALRLNEERLKAKS